MDMVRKEDLHVFKHVSRGENVDAKKVGCGEQIQPKWVTISSNDRFLTHKTRSGVRYPATMLPGGKSDNAHSLALRKRILECHIVAK